MALFTDGGISTIEDLAAHDSGLMGVAGAEGIDLSGKLALAQQELEVELAALLPRIELSGTRNGQPALSVENVVVTRPLRFWHVFHTLELVYRDAYNNQLNDRYKGKWEQYRELSRWAAEKLMETGVGIAPEPLARAAPPRLTAEPGGAATEETTYYARVAWTNAAGEEGAASEWSLLSVGAGMTLMVAAVDPPARATGWNAFVGLSPDELTQQNADPIPLGMPWTQWILIAGDRRPGDGQPPSYVRALPRLIPRG
jgi:hypothetical protein